LSRYSDEELKERVVKGAFLKIALLLMKNIFNPKALADSLEKILSIGKMYYKEEKGTLFLLKVVRYFYAVIEEKKEHEKLKEIVKKAIEKQGVDYMTILESIETEAIKKGEKRGEIHDKQHVLIMLLTQKFALTKKESLFIESVDDREKLDKALKATLTATSKKEVLALLH
jgi:NCAIR mutase (PurE)-related protein